MRQRQSQKSQANLSPKQRTSEINKNKDANPGLQNIPANYFVPGTKDLGISGVGLLKPADRGLPEYNPQTNALGKPTLDSKNVAKWVYFFIETNNQNVNFLEGLIKSFAVVRTLYPTTVQEVSFMLGTSFKNVRGLTLADYETASFSHPSYINDDNQPLQIRYAEIPIYIQRTPGRLDNVPLGSPSFDTTPDGVTTRQGPIPTPPYTNFSTSTGVTTQFFLESGATVDFRDTSVRSPWQFAPTGWYWEFGSLASPTGSTAENPSVFFGVTGSYTVILTASNAAGSTTLSRVNFVNIAVTTTSTTTTTTLPPPTSTTTTSTSTSTSTTSTTTSGPTTTSTSTTSTSTSTTSTSTSSTSTSTTSTSTSTTSTTTSPPTSTTTSSSTTTTLPPTSTTTSSSTTSTTTAAPTSTTSTSTSTTSTTTSPPTSTTTSTSTTSTTTAPPGPEPGGITSTTTTTTAGPGGTTTSTTSTTSSTSTTTTTTCPPSLNVAFTDFSPSVRIENNESYSIDVYDNTTYLGTLDSGNFNLFTFASKIKLIPSSYPSCQYCYNIISPFTSTPC